MPVAAIAGMSRATRTGAYSVSRGVRGHGHEAKIPSQRKAYPCQNDPATARSRHCEGRSPQQPFLPRRAAGLSSRNRRRVLAAIQTPRSGVERGFWLNPPVSYSLFRASVALRSTHPANRPGMLSTPTLSWCLRDGPAFALRSVSRA